MFDCLSRGELFWWELWPSLGDIGGELLGDIRSDANFDSLCLTPGGEEGEGEEGEDDEDGLDVLDIVFDVIVLVLAFVFLEWDVSKIASYKDIGWGGDGDLERGDVRGDVRADVTALGVSTTGDPSVSLAWTSTVGDDGRDDEDGGDDDGGDDEGGDEDWDGGALVVFSIIVSRLTVSSFAPTLLICCFGGKVKFALWISRSILAIFSTSAGDGLGNLSSRRLVRGDTAFNSGNCVDDGWVWDRVCVGWGIDWKRAIHIQEQANKQRVIWDVQKHDSVKALTCTNVLP